MAREYDPRDTFVKVKTYKKDRKLSGVRVSVWHAKCLEDDKVFTGDTEQEALSGFNGHMKNKHKGKTVQKL